MKNTKSLKIAAVSLLFVPTMSYAQGKEAPAPVSTPATSGESSEGTITPPHKDKVESSGAIVPSDQKVELEAPAPVAEAATAESSSGPHLFGLHAGFGIPFLVGYGFDYVPPMNIFSFSLDFGGYSHSASDVKLALKHTDIVARYHPFAGSFFVGLRLGNQSLKAEATETGSYAGFSLTPVAKMEVKNNYMTPHLGWQSNSGGFFISTDFGVQIPNSSSTDLQIDYGTTNATAIAAIEADAEFQKAKQDAVDAGDKFGKTTLPYWGMLRIGYYF